MFLVAKMTSVALPLFLDLLDLLAVVAAEAHFVLLGGGLATNFQAQLTRLLDNLLEGKLGHVVGDPERQPLLDVGPGVDNVDLFRLTAGGLNIEEETKDQTDEVKQREEKIETPSTGVGEKRREHDDSKVADPVGARRSSSTHGTGTEGVDLGRVNPGQRQDGEGKESDEKEDTDSSTLGVLLGGIDQASECDDETETLAEETNQVQLATADSFDQEEGWDGGKGINGSKDTTHDQRQVVIHLNVIPEKHS